ncbi:hypothetical protein P6F26_16890 [Roseibacterium sp. SDUM158017]|uniref:hypothetical protein n=1 Tax=Roseicyclus salinarum TaxID=3036773 RepID=UPI0024150817|nr:hypothetical protein [Roseibacterium sp. SDUM158017]MDG4650127.1 hypothetical protein [Roseibacterium sp. SDUM158017]
MQIGIGIFIGSTQAVDAPPFTLALTGLSTDSLGDYAQIGDHAGIGYTATDGNGDPVVLDSVSWGTSAGDSTFGTGASPTAIASADEGSLVLTGTKDGVTRSISAPVRYAASVNITEPAFNVETATLEDVIDLGEGVWTGAVGGTFLYEISDGTTTLEQPTYTIAAGDANKIFTGRVGYENSGGLVWANASNNVQVGTFDFVQSGGSLTGSGVEATALSFGSDTWTYGGVAATVSDREYRLLVGGVLVDGPQATASLDIPDDTAGQAYIYQMRVTITDPVALQSGWITVASGEVGSSLEVTLESGNLISATWTGTLTNIVISGTSPFNGAYTTFADGTALLDTHVVDVAGRALAILPTTGTGEVGQALTAGEILVLYASGQTAPTVTIQWQRDGVDISGATGAGYTLASGDSGTTVRPTFVITASGATTVVENGAGIAVTGSAPSVNSITGQTDGIHVDHDGTLTITPTAEGLTLEVA